MYLVSSVSSVSLFDIMDSDRLSCICFQALEKEVKEETEADEPDGEKPNKEEVEEEEEEVAYESENEEVLMVLSCLIQLHFGPTVCVTILSSLQSLLILESLYI